MNKAPHSYYKIRFNDCDMFGHLNNARYLDYMINARQDHLKDVYGFDFSSYYKNNLGWVISSHEVQYLKPAFFEENVLIQSSLIELNSESLVAEIIMTNESKSHLKAFLRSKLTFINIKSGQKEQHSLEFMDWAKSLVREDGENCKSVQVRVNEILTEIKKSNQNEKHM